MRVYGSIITPSHEEEIVSIPNEMDESLRLDPRWVKQGYTLLWAGYDGSCTLYKVYRWGNVRKDGRGVILN